MLGPGEVTVNSTPLLETLPEDVTTTLPVVAPLGTGTTIVVVFQLVGFPETPLNVTVPWVEPKFVPETVTEVPIGPEVGLMLEMFGPAPPPPVAGLNAPTTAPQLSEAPRDALAEARPAADCI